jgi:hypothetical protein
MFDEIVTVVPIPEEGTLAYQEAVFHKQCGIIHCMRKGKRYRAAKEGEAPTHHRNVKNGLGFYGFVLYKEEKEEKVNDGKNSSTDSTCSM